MERPIVFFIIIGIALVLFLNYGGTSFFSSGPLATGPGPGTDVENPPEPQAGGSFFGFIPSPGSPAGEERSPESGMEISFVRTSASGPGEEYIVIKRSGFSFSGDEAGETVDISGWTIENGRGTRYTIPVAFNIPNANVPAGPIKLGSGDEVIVVSGSSTFGSSFRENMCTGYFAEFHEFAPPLDESCPEFSRDELLRQGLNSVCVEAVGNTPRCRQVRIGFEQSAAGNECVDFVGMHLNYAGCLRDNRSRDDFFGKTWRVFLNSRQNIWDSLHDRAILRNKEGAIIDEYSY